MDFESGPQRPLSNYGEEKMDDTTSTVAAAARWGNRLLNLASGTGILALFLVGGYMIWYTVMVYQSAFLDEDLLKYKPTISEGGNPSLYDLMEINPDVCGWITIEGTNIDYPIVYGKDNQEYLKMDVFREYSLAGSVFLDHDNSRDFSDPYNILYGHHMDNGAMFGQIIDFLDEDFFEAHPNGILFLPEATYAISFFESLEANAYDLRLLSVTKKQSMMAPLLSLAKSKAKQYRDLEPALSGNDTVVALVTCENAFTDGRAVLLGRLNQIEYVQQGGE